MCIPKTIQQRQVEPQLVNVYSALSVTFATLSVIVSFSIFPVCTEWICWYTDRAYVYDICFWTLYTMAKIFMYLLFVGRLFNPYYQRIYQYSKYIQYLLWMMLILLLAVMIDIVIGDVISMKGIEYPKAIDDASIALYGVTDCITATILLILFFRPICKGVYMSIVKIYAGISALQWSAAVLYQVSFISTIYLYASDASQQVWDVYHNIARVIQLLDCCLLMVCIHIGFARVNTVCKLCQRTEIVSTDYCFCFCCDYPAEVVLRDL